MTRDTLDIVKKRKNFYRDHYYRLLKVLFWLLVMILLLLTITAYVYFNRPAERYFATNSGGMVDQLIMTSGPNMSSEPLLPPDQPSDTETTQKNYNFDSDDNNMSVNNVQ